MNFKGITMRIFLVGFISLFFFASAVNAENGLITIKSSHDVSTTSSRLQDVLKAKGMRVFTVINHTEGAKGVGIELRPTVVVIFGNPKVGTPIMLCGQTMAIDLPQKALIWEDKEGAVWLTYNDPRYMEKRHNTTGCEKFVSKIEKALGNFAKAATKP